MSTVKISSKEESVKKIILAVDDLATNLAKIKEILDDEYDVRLAKNAQMALSMLNRIDVSLILMDIEMPGMTGFDFMRERAKNDHNKSDIPVIFVTGHASKEFVVRAAHAGARDYIAKPFDAETLRRKVKNALISAGGMPFSDFTG
jgi:putative two-component system response regulator